ncbi:MAG: hypothetical protein SGJ21_15075 [Alphaproteobacteria bacterium]|nr:hypothetical protein [Alphaproteobacteria bacterium]
MRRKPRKLEIALIPGPLWNFNLREFLSPGQWRKLRMQHIEKYGAFCQTCGKDVSARGAAQGHEVWEYDTSSTPAVARLKGLSLACWHCHMAEHWGRLENLSGTLTRAVPDTIKHYCNVNGVTRPTWKRDKVRAFAEWRRLSRLEWELDWGEYAPMLLARYVELPQLYWYTDLDKDAA